MASHAPTEGVLHHEVPECPEGVQGVFLGLPGRFLEVFGQPVDRDPLGVVDDRVVYGGGHHSLPVALVGLVQILNVPEKVVVVVEVTYHN